VAESHDAAPQSVLKVRGCITFQKGVCNEITKKKKRVISLQKRKGMLWRNLMMQHRIPHFQDRLRGCITFQKGVCNEITKKKKRVIPLPFLHQDFPKGDLIARKGCITFLLSSPKGCCGRLPPHFQYRLRGCIMRFHHSISPPRGYRGKP
jgi:hypothetical protein